MRKSNINLLILSAAVAVCALLLAGCDEDPQPQQNTAEVNPVTDDNKTAAAKSVNSDFAAATTTTAANSTAIAPAAIPADAHVTTTSNPNAPTLGKIIANRKGWGPVYINWYGETSPDFTVTDITGKSHTLSNYKGRNVLLVFWATWCGPCKIEIPHLHELRKSYTEDQLMILAISYDDPRNSTRMVREFVQNNPLMNYTVISVDNTLLPRPYNTINAIPSSFYIDKQGKIKFAAEGIVNIAQMKQIIEAER